jgi:hypothetical protein
MKNLIVLTLALIALVSCSPSDQMVGTYSLSLLGKTDTFTVSKTSDGVYECVTSEKHYTLRPSTKAESEKLFGDKLKWGTYTGLVSDKEPILIIKADAPAPELQIKKPGYYFFLLLGFVELEKTK